MTPTDRLVGRSRDARRSGRILVLGAVLGAALLGCGVDDGPPIAAPTPIPSEPAPTAGVAAAQTRGELVRVLGERRLILADAQRPFRPAESPTLTTAPRAVYQVTLPADPDDGYIVVYELLDPNAAAAAASEQARYLASGPGRVQSPLGAVHVIRQVGSTVVLYSWLPEAADDPAAPEIQAALETLGIGVPVPG